MARPAKQAVLDKNQNKLHRCTNILISGMTVERGVEEGEGGDNLNKYLHYCLSERPSEERNILYVLVCVIGVKVMIVNTEETFGNSNWYIEVFVAVKKKKKVSYLHLYTTQTTVIEM